MLRIAICDDEAAMIETVRAITAHFLRTQGVDGEIQCYSRSVTHYTGIEAIDFILTQKLNDAQAQGIHVTANAEFPKDCAIDPVDLCTILTNLLDNAIRAAAACPDGTLSLSIRRFRQTILIRVTNSAMAPPRTAGRRFLTTKRDAAHHGWGLASVTSAAEKYDGTLETSYEDGQFSASVLLFYQ